MLTPAMGRQAASLFFTRKICSSPARRGSSAGAEGPVRLHSGSSPQRLGPEARGAPSNERLPVPGPSHAVASTLASGASSKQFHRVFHGAVPIPASVGLVVHCGA